MNYRHKQAGGTFLGIIIGLIIGLGIAVGVAVTINKTPIPFVDRGFKPNKDAGAEGGQMPDLNKSLYGNREPARQAAKEFQKEAEPAVAAEPAAPGQAATAPATPAAPAAAPGKAPAADKVPAAENAAAREAAASEEKWTYYLQAGAFREQADAENAKAKLALLGVESSISERSADTGTLYRVRVGPFAQVDAMNRVRSKLSDNGVDVAVVRIQK